MSKTITKEQHLQALGLFSMAAHHAQEAERFRQGLARLLNVPAKSLGHIDDAMFDDRKQTPRDLDTALADEGYVIDADTETTT